MPRKPLEITAENQTEATLMNINESIMDLVDAVRELTQAVKANRTVSVNEFHKLIMGED